MAPTLTKDVGKAAKDLIEKEFPSTRGDAPAFDVNVEFKGKTSAGEGLAKVGSNLGDALTASLEHTFTYKPWNLAVKETLESAGNLKAEVSLTDAGLKGLKSPDQVAKARGKSPEEVTPAGVLRAYNETKRLARAGADGRS